MPKQPTGRGFGKCRWAGFVGEYGAVELEQNNQTETDDADHAAVGDDLQAVEGNVGRNGNCAGLVGGGLLQI